MYLTHMSRFLLTPSLSFPFLTAQWKSQKGDAGHFQASIQGARDGAASCNMLNKFYLASGRKGTVVETCHFSITCDIASVMLWVHWRQEEDNSTPEQFHMECIAKAWLVPGGLHDDRNILLMRDALRNILDYSLHDRLNSIKEAIAKLPAQSAKRGTKRSASKRSTGSLESIAEDASEDATEAGTGQTTAESSVSGARKKKSRTSKSSHSTT
jgi:hypothetical protein